MGACLGCFRKKDYVSEVNQDDNPSINVHFSNSRLSDTSSQEPTAIVARNTQENAKCERVFETETFAKASLLSLSAHRHVFNFAAKLEAPKNKAATSVTGDSDKAKTTTSKAAKNGGGDEPQRISLKTLMQDDANEDKAALQEPIRSEFESHEPIGGKAGDQEASKGQLSDGKNHGWAVVDGAKEGRLTSAADDQCEIEAKKIKQHVVVQAEGEALKAKRKNFLPNENVVKVGNEVEPGVLEVGNEGKVSSAETEAQADAESNLIKVADEAVLTIPEAVELLEQSVATKTVVEPQVASERQNVQNPTSENELQSEPEVRDDLQQDRNDKIADKNVDIDCVDVSFARPLVPQLSEIVRVGVIARVPEDGKPIATEPSNNNIVAEDGEESDIVENAEK